MDPLTIFWILWLLVLPILGITFAIGFPVFWFFIVPKVARVLTWCRFKNVSFHFISDDTGYAYLVPSAKDVIPEGVVQTKNFGYRLLPRLGATNPTGDEKGELAKRLLLRKYVWADMGKPIWFGYAGKVACFNPATLALLEQGKAKGNPDGNVVGLLEEIKSYVRNLPKVLTVKSFGREKTFNLKDDLLRMLEKLESYVKFQTYTPFDPTIIKSVIPKMFTPSQLKALALNREHYGMLKRGKEYGKLIIGASVIMGILVFGIVALSILRPQ